MYVSLTDTSILVYINTLSKTNTSEGLQELRHTRTLTLFHKDMKG